MLLIFILYILKKSNRQYITRKYSSVCMAWENGVEDDAKKGVSLVKDMHARALGKPYQF